MAFGRFRSFLRQTKEQPGKLVLPRSFFLVDDLGLPMPDPRSPEYVVLAIEYARRDLAIATLRLRTVKLWRWPLALVSIARKVHRLRTLSTLAKADLLGMSVWENIDENRSR